MDNFWQMFYLRLKVRLAGKEWQFDIGDLDASKVIFQIAVTIPMLFGLDFEIFI